MPSLLSISSHIAWGRVGQSVTSFAFQRLGIDARAIPTVVLPNVPGPGGKPGMIVPAAAIEMILEGIADSGGLDGLSALHIGYLRAPEQVMIAARAIERVRAASPGAIICVDPIMGDNGRLYIPADTAAAICRVLVPRADLLTPNRFELETIVGRALASEAEAVAAAGALHAHVLCSSAPASDASLVSTMLADGRAAWRCETPHVEGAPNGTGDLLTALFLARRIKGESAMRALAAAVSSVHDLLNAARAAGLAYLPTFERQELLVSPASAFEAIPILR